MSRLIAILWTVLLLSLSITLHGQARSLDQETQQRAQALAQRFLITDGHVDLPYRLRVQNFRMEKEYLGIPIETDDGDFDYRRAKTGGLDAPFMSIYIPARYQETGGAKTLADSLIDMIHGIADIHPDKFRVTNSVSETQAAWQDGAVALPMGMENGAPVEDDLQNLAYFKQRGISYITLTHSKDNQICDSSYDTTRTWNGLSPFGQEVVKEMNEVGIMIDISHVSDSAFWQVMALSEAPCIASHSSARKFTPGFERNMNDDMIKALAINGGVIQINFGSTFLDGKVQAQRDSLRTLMQQKMKAAGITYQDEGFTAFAENFQRAHPALFADVQTVADHIDHVVVLTGVDHVAFGSDFDGVGDSLPTGLKDVSMYPNLIAELLRRGYSDTDIEKICSGNIFRVWRQVELRAQEK